MGGKGKRLISASTCTKRTERTNLLWSLVTQTETQLNCGLWVNHTFRFFIPLFFGCKRKILTSFVCLVSCKESHHLHLFVVSFLRVYAWNSPVFNPPILYPFFSLLPSTPCLWDVCFWRFAILQPQEQYLLVGSILLGIGNLCITFSTNLVHEHNRFTGVRIFLVSFLFLLPPNQKTECVFWDYLFTGDVFSQRRKPRFLLTLSPLVVSSSFVFGR